MIEREVSFKDMVDYVKDLCSGYFDEKSWILNVDTLIDRDVHIVDYLFSLWAFPLGLFRYDVDILRSLPYRGERLDRKYETYLLLQALKVNGAEPAIKVTHPLKGIDFALDRGIAEVLKDGKINDFYIQLGESQLDEMEDQCEDQERDRRTNQPNMFDSRIENGVRIQLRRWDAFYSRVIKNSDLISLEKQWDEWKKISPGSKLKRIRYDFAE